MMRSHDMLSKQISTHSVCRWTVSLITQNYQVIALTAFEKYGIVLEYLPSLENNSFNAIPRDTAVELVSESDVVILTDP